MKPAQTPLTDAHGWRYEWAEFGLQMDVCPLGSGREATEAEITMRALTGEVWGHMHQGRVDLTSTRSKEILARYLGSRGSRKVNWADLVEQAAVLTVRAIRGGVIEAPATESIADLMASELPAPRMVVDGILTEGCWLLAGHPKTGKSWWMLDMGLPVAYGGAALGSVPVEQGRVLYLALEDSRIRLQSRVGAKIGSDPPPAAFEYRTAWTALDSGGLEELDQWLAARPDTRLVMIDTLGRVRGNTRRNGRIYDEDYQLMAGLQDLAGRRHVCILVSMHLRKGGADDPLELLSGTMGLSGGVDGILILQRKRYGDDATLSVIARDLPDNRELGLRWDREHCAWLLVGDAADVRLSAERTAIVEMLREVAEPLSPKDLAEMTELPYGSVRRLLSHMTRAGQVRRLDRGRYLVGETPLTDNRPTGATAQTGDHREHADQGDLGEQAINRENAPKGDHREHRDQREQREQAINGEREKSTVNERSPDRNDHDDRVDRDDRPITREMMRCPGCYGGLATDGVCWECMDRPCTECGRLTGSTTRSRCMSCAIREAG